MRKSSPLIGRLSLVFLTIVSVIILITQSSTILTKNYFESYNYQHQERDFLRGLNEYVLNPIDEEASIAAIEVSDEEVEYYRSYYGTLSEQILKIQEQYNERLLELEEQNNSVVAQALIEERDQKIAEVKRNFEDAAYVQEKIKNAKLKSLKKYIAQVEEKRQEFFNSYTHYGYVLKDVEGNQVESGNTSESRVFNKKVTITPGLLINDNGQEYVTDRNAADEVGIDISKSIQVIRTNETYKGSIFITKSSFEQLGSEADYYTFTFMKWMYYFFIILGIISFILLVTKYKLTKNHLDYFEVLRQKVPNWPVDIMLVIGAILLYFTLGLIESFIYNLGSLTYMVRYSNPEQLFEIIINALLGFSMLILTIFTIWSIYQTIKETPFEKLQEKLFIFIALNRLKALFLNKSIGVQTFFLFIVFYLGGFGLLIAFENPGYLLFYTFLFVSVLLPAMYMYLSRMSDLNKVMKQTEQMAQGKLTDAIRIKGKSPIAKHAENLNALQEGVKKSVSEQAKSERLKTELITNVSHDLRTPLTSIITYTDLLKNPNLSEEERAKYVSILDQKSERLKVLIEDLFEVSKMASGNVELQKSKIDVAQLLQQISGEQVDDFEAANLDLRMTITTQPMMAFVDAQKLYRVFDNLFNNALKYSLAGTRVYANAEMNNEQLVFTMKNVSKYELSTEASELTERFKRADLARHTEGSGLGLAIATSIIDMHKGSLEVEADGDLFKLTIRIPLN